MKEYKIKQIIPAPEWMGVKFYFKDKPPETIFERVACLALVEDEDGDERVIAVSESDCGSNWDGHFTVESGSKDCIVNVVSGDWTPFKKPDD